MNKMTGKEKLVNAHILLQCADTKHGCMCAKLRDALIDNFNEVKEADVVTQITGDTDFCVSGIAKISSKKIDKFKTALDSLQANFKKSSQAKNVRIYIEAK